MVAGPEATATWMATAGPAKPHTGSGQRWRRPLEKPLAHPDVTFCRRASSCKVGFLSINASCQLTAQLCLSPALLDHPFDARYPLITKTGTGCLLLQHGWCSLLLCLLPGDRGRPWPGLCSSPNSPLPWSCNKSCVASQCWPVLFLHASSVPTTPSGSTISQECYSQIAPWALPGCPAGSACLPPACP